MPILDELANHTPALMLGLQSEHIAAPSPTVNLLDRFAKYKTGRAGDDIGITHLIAQGEGRWYRDYDTADRQAAQGTVGHRAQWVNYQNDVDVAGTQLEATIGRTTAELVHRDMSLSRMQEDDRMEFLSILATRLRVSAEGGQNDKIRSCWGRTVPGDDITRMPESLTALFDETAAYHGLGITGLGTWDSGRHPWATNPPNTDASTNRHIPQIFHNSGTPRTVSKAILDGPSALMMGMVPGFWLAPTYPSVYSTLAADAHDAVVQIPMGSATVTYNVEAVRIGNSFYFADSWAETDRIKHLHIGTPGAGDASFFPYYWVSRSAQDIRNLLSRPTPVIPGALSNFGTAAVIPWYAQQWIQRQGNADVIGNNLQLKYAYVCTYRWKQYEVRDLQA